MTAVVTAAMAAWYVDHFKSSTSLWKQAKKFCNSNNVTCALAITATLTPLRLGQCMQSVKRHSISWKVTEHVPHHAGVGSGWFGQRHFISFYSMLHAAARLVGQWLSEHIMFAYRISKAAWHNVHDDVAWFWYLFACLLENLAVESSAAWVPHIVAAPVLWTHQVENQGDHANWSLRLSTQHGIYQQLHILHHLYVHYLHNRSIHRQNIMKCEYMMIYECTVCVERLTSWRTNLTLDTFQTRDQSFLDWDHPARQLLNPALQSKGMWPW